MQSRHESESVDVQSFDSNRKMTSDQVRKAQLLDCNRLGFQVVAKQRFLAISPSVFVFEIPNNRRLWWRAQQGRYYIRCYSFRPGNHGSDSRYDWRVSGEVVTEV